MRRSGMASWITVETFIAVDRGGVSDSEVGQYAFPLCSKVKVKQAKPLALSIA